MDGCYCSDNRNILVLVVVFVKVAALEEKYL